MNSIERKNARYERRKAKRQTNRDKIIEGIGTAEEVFNYHDMFKYGQDCCKGVMWKQAPQTFKRHLFSRTAVNRKNALNGYKPKPLVHFTLNERGKTRPIDAPHIDDRQIQKVLTKKVLIPLYLPRMIYDNGASLKGKGLMFSQAQLDKALHNHLKEYGYEGYVIIADFKSFFPNADREVIKGRHKEVKDDKLREILDAVTDNFDGDIGLPLGVEPSQLEMIALPSPLDNYMSCQLGLKGFGHYMDDYHLFVPPDRSPKEVLDLFIQKAGELGIKVSTDKTQIIKIGKPFKYCKRKRIYADDTIISLGDRKSKQRLRRKIKSFAKNKDMQYEDIYTSVNSSLAYFDRTDNHGTVLRARRLFYSLFGFSCEDIREFRRRDNEIYMSQQIQEDGCEREGVPGTVQGRD